MPSVGAFIRLRNEATWLPHCLESILGVFDQVVLATQGEQDDNTFEICREWAMEVPRWQHVHFPYLSHPNGEGHDKYPKGFHERSYFYNWTLHHLNTEYACKWDGDMIAFDWFGDWLRETLEARPDMVCFHGVDVVGDIHHVGEREHCAAEWRVFRASPETHYVTGPRCEVLHTPYTRGVTLERPAFLHTKWAKPEQEITKAWPKDWRDQPHFARLWMRSKAVKEYRGELPRVLRREDRRRSTST